MKLKKKILSTVATLLIISGVIINNVYSYADTTIAEEESINQVVEKNNLDLAEISNLSSEELAEISSNLVKTRSNKKILIYNNSKPIEGSFVAEKNDCNVYAVYIENVDGIEYISTYAVHDSLVVTEENIGEFIQNISDKAIKDVEESKSNRAVEPRAVFGDTVKFSGGTYTYRTTITKKGNTTYNNKAVSVWDIKSFNQAEFGAGCWNTITRLDFKQPNQEVQSYGPHSISSGGSGSINLKSMGSAIKADSWAISLASGIKVQDSSSLVNKYTRWTTSSLLVKPSITSEYAARVTNAVGKFIVKPSHSIGVQMGAQMSVPVIYHTLDDR